MGYFRLFSKGIHRGGVNTVDNGASSYRRFLEGDDNGIAEIVNDYKDGLILYLNKYVSNIHIAEDLAEDTFFKIMVRKPRYTKKYTFQAWLYAIGRNVAIDHIRKQAKYAKTSVDDLEMLVSEEETLEQAYIKDEEKIMIHRVLEQLKPEYKQVLWLVYFEGFSNEQAARIMKKSRHQTETLVYRAKRALRRELGKENFSYEGF